MEGYDKKTWMIGQLKFIILSIIGIFLFLTPLEVDGKTSLPVAVLAKGLLELLGNFTPTLIYLIIILSVVLTFYCSFIHKPKSSYFNQLFNVNWIWFMVRLLGGIFATLVFFNTNIPIVDTEATGQLIYEGLLPTLIAVFFFAGLFLPFLMDYGLLEFLGPMFSKVMRPLFTLPGRSAVDNLASFIGDGTVGVMITSKQYEGNFFTRREATVIATSFSVVSITFAIVVCEQVKLMDYFFQFYGTVIVSCLIAAIIMPRIWPLSKIPDHYANGRTEIIDESTPVGHTIISYGYENATIKAIQAPGWKLFWLSGVKTVGDMWFAVLPVVMCIGTLATMVAEHTPFFSILGIPFVPLLELLHIPEAKAASETILIGFADMFLPSILIEGVKSDLTRFVIGALSISQLIYLSEVGGVILGSKIPVSLPKLFVIFLMRTIICLPIITLMAHFIF
ncbi:YjiH family protein [Macrococcoides caseolyticum]|uniref:YjiH family protein n=1 Tax=Macrococcoides caseolyticum TaxID=69966 RepID=UPI001F2D2C4B|nr:YjiH family protein [Macrococcus caseolyticus]MCE4957294.1 YjiH family protein [Macrococcus caseolyticus]